MADFSRPNSGAGKEPYCMLQFYAMKNVLKHATQNKMATSRKLYIFLSSISINYCGQTTGIFHGDTVLSSGT